MKILCVIVLYKLTLEESIAYKSFVKYALDKGEIGLYVYDNSPLPIQTRYGLSNQGIEYVADPSNSGISKAYNSAAGYARQHGYDWLLFTDQDTTYPDDTYASKCLEIINSMPSLSLIVPVVNTQKGVFSPLLCKHHVPDMFNYKIGEKNLLKGCAIINSGMCVRVNTFLEAGGYNEMVPLDYSDYQFIERLQTVEREFYLADYNILQSFSDEVDDDESLLWRFKSIKKSVCNFEGSFMTRVDMKYILLKRCLSLTIRKRNLKFIKIFLFN